MTAEPGAAFAHASEAEMARILDFYGIRWQYEPHTFPILWNLDGEVVESFSPDFFLEDLDLYLEMTTLRQKLVRKKNRKLRRLRELYPDVRIKLFYARDFRALMLKYGKVALADALSGTAGQVSRPFESIERTASVVEALQAVQPVESLLPEPPFDVPAPPVAAPVGAPRDRGAAGRSAATVSRRRRRRRQALISASPTEGPDLR